MAGKDWYSPGEIHFNRRQALWLIQNLGSLWAGSWPPEASSYVDTNVRKKGVSRRAPFATPIEYAAEIESRLEETGVDGLMLEATQCWGKSEDSISNYFKISNKRVRRRYKRALRYIASGRCPRWIDCPGAGECVECKSCKNYKDKDGNIKCKKNPREGESYQDFKEKA